MFIVLSLNPYVKYTRPHAFFNIMFMDHNRVGSFTFNLKRCYMRWSGSYVLLYNLFYYNHNILIFGHKIFRVDILALNTLTCPPSKFFFKHATPFYNFKDSIYGSTMDNLIKVLKAFKLQTAFISDLTNHEKTAVSLKKADVYTVGIVPFSTNPWVVSYPIPVHSSGMFTQYYFIRYIYHVQQQASFSRFDQLKNLWSRF